MDVRTCRKQVRRDMPEAAGIMARMRISRADAKKKTGTYPEETGLGSRKYDIIFLFETYGCRQMKSCRVCIAGATAFSPRLDKS